MSKERSGFAMVSWQTERGDSLVGSSRIEMDQGDPLPESFGSIEGVKNHTVTWPNIGIVRTQTITT